MNDQGIAEPVRLAGGLTTGPDAVAAASVGATRLLAQFVVATALEDLPGQVVPRLRDLFLDWLGNAAFAATHAENSPSLYAGITRLDPSEGPATVVGASRGFSWPYAALLNGAHAHSLDFDDTNAIQTGHPGAPVIAAALADAERLGTDGRAFYQALAVGYEVACRVGAAQGQDGYNRGFHITSTAGIFGAVAAIAKLRSFDCATLEHAWGLALSKAAGTMQYLANGAWNKRLHPGFAAHDALLCAALAEAGVIGAASAFEGKHGFLVSYTGAPHPDALTQRLGEDWVLLQTAVKPYPSCRLTHGAVDAALALRNSVPAAERAEVSMCIDISPVAMQIVGGDLLNKRAPQNSVDAQFSVYFQVAAAWLDGQVDWSTYNCLDAPDRAALIKRIALHVATGLPANGAVLTVEAGGQAFTSTVEYPLGEPQNWIGDDRLRRKFMLLAGRTYGEAHAARIADCVQRLGPDGAIGSLIALLRRAPVT